MSDEAVFIVLVFPQSPRKLVPIRVEYAVDRIEAIGIGALVDVDIVVCAVDNWQVLGELAVDLRIGRTTTVVPGCRGSGETLINTLADRQPYDVHGTRL